MRTFLLSAVLAFTCSSLFAQTPADSIPMFRKSPPMPAFTLMVLPDSSAFTREDLKPKEATIIMVFSPDCEHCIHSTEDLLAHYDLFKNVQIVMGTPLAYVHIKNFYDKYKIAEYPNIKMGLDNNYVLGSYYQLRNYPSIFLYDKNGKFKAFFDGSVKWEKIAQSL